MEPYVLYPTGDPQREKYDNKREPLKLIIAKNQIKRYNTGINIGLSNLEGDECDSSRPFRFVFGICPSG